MKIVISVTGSEGDFGYAFPSGAPIGAPYPLPNGNFVGRVDWLDYLAFWGMIDQEMPESVDVLDVAYLDAHGVREVAEADFRAEVLINRVAEQCGLGLAPVVVAENFDAIEVKPVRVWGFDLSRGKVTENVEAMECADVTEDGSIFWTVYGHVRQDSPIYGPNAGGVESWFDFTHESDARAMASQLASVLKLKQ